MQHDELGEGDPEYRVLSAAQRTCLGLDLVIVGAFAWILSVDWGPCGTGEAFVLLGVLALFVVATIVAWSSLRSVGPPRLSRILFTCHALVWLALGVSLALA